MKQILKRLELISTSIQIDDEEIIELQIMKLEKLELDDEVRKILSKLEEFDYGSAAVDIECYLKKFTGVVEYIDPEVQGLRLELKMLEKKLQSLSELKTEYLNDIDEFNTQYSIKLGEIIRKILKLEEEKLQEAIDEKQKEYDERKKTYEETKETVKEIEQTLDELEEILDAIDEDDADYEELKSTYEALKEEQQKLEDELEEQEEELEHAKEEMEDDPLFEEYSKAKTNYEEFNNEYEEIKHTIDDRYDLNEEEKAKLKKLFRKASRLCHPDLVADKLKEQAHTLMLQLNETYAKKDLGLVTKLLLSLESGTGFALASDSIDDKNILKAKIAEFRESIETFEADIASIKQDETFETIQNIDDMDTYFEELYEELYEELKLQYDALKKSDIVLLEDDEMDAMEDTEPDLLSEDEDVNYFSTTATAKSLDFNARPHLFDRLMELNLLYKDAENHYRLTEKGEALGGKYFENEKGEQWVVWREHALDGIIAELKENLGFVSPEAHKLTPHQRKVYNEIISDLNDIFKGDYEDNRISLSGSAGVGKTFLTIKIIQELQKNNFNTVVTAPTHKALSVIGDSLKKYGIKGVKLRTLHSFLHLKMDIEEETGKKIFVPNTEKKDKEYAGVLIVDESSMIGNDLFDYINDEIQSKRVGAVLFVGDPYQLPPVNSEKNSIFTLQQSYMLKQVIRQKEDSYIITIATKIRDCIINKDFSHSINSFFASQMEGLEIFDDRGAFLSAFYGTGHNGWDNKNQIIADYTNDSVNFYNKVVRDEYWRVKGNHHPKQLEVGDVVIFQDSYLAGDEIRFDNGSVAKIKKCSKALDKKYKWEYWLCVDEYGDEFKVMSNESNPTYMNMLEGKIEIAKNATPGFARRNSWVDYYKLKERYASIKFNYASTIHKLQGSTYETVFIDIRKMQNLYRYSENVEKEFLYRLLYVAVTRASDDIVVLK